MYNYNSILRSMIEYFKYQFIMNVILCMPFIVFNKLKKYVIF